MSDLPAPLLAELEAGVGLERLAELAGIEVALAREAEELGLLPHTLRGGGRVFSLPAYRALKTADRLETGADIAPASAPAQPATASAEEQLARLRELRAALTSAGEKLRQTAANLEGERAQIEAMRRKTQTVAEIEAEREAVEELRERNERRAQQLVARTTALKSASNFRAVTGLARTAVRRSKAKKSS